MYVRVMRIAIMIISAVAGKAGAVICAFGFLFNGSNKDKTKTDAGYPVGVGVIKMLVVFCVINFLGMLFMLLVSEATEKSLEELSGENVEETKMTELEELPVGYTNRIIPS
ncbi:hypothetical protein GIB67_004571 [Kingdonia uniflora]|uniref:Uncharacterized protein n=1 Tax=Kingdonia uniflora TaxID=39325 RepID=A0A7J7ML67_9MAGN|nr:hypothetical protein GIB67_004571 [Kingdonia uniflora]